MNRYFADAYFFVALLSPTDKAHHSANRFLDSATVGFVTTDWIITEVANSLSAPRRRPQVIELVELLESNKQATIVRFSARLHQAGWELYRSRQDKGWSLTDCISFVVMSEQGISDALTGDHHFEQAGFTAVFADLR